MKVVFGWAINSFVKLIIQLNKKILTKDEEADEIIRRLSTPPVKKPRFLNATWTMQDVDDLSTKHGLDLEAEIAKVLAMEIDKELLEELKASYGKGNIRT